MSKVQAMDTLLQSHVRTFVALSVNLMMAQNRLKQQANQRQYERSFEVDNLVFIRLQPYK